MKRFLLLTLAFGVWVLAAPVGVLAQSTQTAILSLDPSNGTFNQGCSFSLNVLLDTGGVSTDGTDAILAYDTARITATSITNGTVYHDYPGNNIDATGGKVTISGLAAAGSPFSGKGVLATVNFTVSSTAATGATQIKFDFDPTGSTYPTQCTQNGTTRNTCDSNVVQQGTVVDMLGTVNNGSYVIGTGSCSAQPTPSSSPAAGAGQGSGTGTTTRSGTGVTPGYMIGGPGTTMGATPSAGGYAYVPMKTLPNGGTQEFTFTLAIMGSALTVLGILGLALL